jgi:Tol biopolymer transport system component
MYVGDFSADLDKGVFFALSPVTQEDPNVVNVPNLYLRDDLLSSDAGHYRLLSGCPACSSPLSAPPFEIVRPGLVVMAGASDDFSHVIFESKDNLLPGAEGGEPKLYESVNGVTRLAGILPDSACGTPPCVASGSVAGRGAIKRFASGQELTSDAISRDGSRIVFTAAPFATPESLGGTLYGLLYLREDGVRSVQLNASERSPADTPQPASFVAASADASKIFFVTDEQLTEDDTDGQLNLYMYNVDAPAGHHLTLLSKTESVSTGESEATDVVGTSSDGGYVYFYGQAKLLAGQSTVPGLRQLYVWHHGELRYIGSGSGVIRNDVPWRGSSVLPGQMTSQVRVSPDGKHMVFVTRSVDMAEKLGYNNDVPRCLDGAGAGCTEVYLYSYDSDSVVCISCDANGALPLDNAAITSKNERDTTKFTTTQHLANALSEDGNVFFDSPDPLVSQDVNGKYDVYEYVVASGTLRLISSGQSNGDSRFDDATPDGRNVFFTTSQRLVGTDIDGNADLYDARIDGGIAAQQDVSVATECTGDLCQGDSTGSPALSLPASLTFAGTGNLSGVAQTVTSAKPKAKAKRKAKAKGKAKVRKRRVTRHGRAGKARTPHKSHSAGR